MQRNSGEQIPKQSSEGHRLSILRKAFDVYDEDGSGSIDYQELKRLLEDLGWPSHEEFLNRAVRVLDQDMSGEIEFSEFQKWTDFAYASRILYRQEMYGSGPRYSSGDDIGLRPVAEDSPDGKGGLVIRRASLTTVFEGQEDGGTKTLQAKCDKSAGYSSDEDEKVIERRALIHRNYGENVHYDEKPYQMTDRLGITKHSATKDVRIRRNLDLEDSFRPHHGKLSTGRSSKSELYMDEATKEQSCSAEQGKVAVQQFSMPIRRMATMLLGPSRRGNRIHTSRSRSKSAGILSDRRSGRTSRVLLETPSRGEMGPRTESKMTVRMRWACGQFRNAMSNSESHSGSSSQSNDGCGSQNENEPKYQDPLKMCSPAGIASCEKSGRVSEDSVCRCRSEHANMADEIPSSESYDVLQKIGIDLRRIRSE